MKTCKICEMTKPLTEFNPTSKYKDKIYYRGECKECNLKTQSTNQSAQIKYRNSENGKEKKAAYKKTEKYRTSQREYESIRTKEDKLFRLKKRIRDRTGKALKNKGWAKNSSFAEYIGCSPEELKQHLEKQFIEGMNWDNYGHGKEKWTIDHRQALSTALTEEEMYKLCHYTNLQPMWYIDNIKKGNKV